MTHIDTSIFVQLHEATISRLLALRHSPDEPISHTVERLISEKSNKKNIINKKNKL